MARVLGFVVMAWAAFGVARADQSAPPTVGGGNDSAAAIEAIRGDIVALDLEKALAAIDSLLARPGLPDATRADAFELRAQAHVAGDDLDAAERDYRAILELRPDYVPNPELMTRRATERFVRVEAATVGRIHLDLDPPDAALTLDGRAIVRAGAGSFKAIAGERRLRVDRRGFDPAELPVRVVAGEETLLKVVLVPNARHLVVRTDVAGVAVALDGTAVGTTARPSAAEAVGSVPAELLIEDVAIGEHVLTLQKSCFATEKFQEIVRVDMADRSPERLRVATMRPARTRVTAAGAAYAGELRVDGDAVAALPLETFTMCPGRRAIEVVASGRVVWSGVMDAGETDMTLDLSPRPTCVLVGAEWPKAWGAAATAWSLRDRVDPPAAADLTSAQGWAPVTLPPGTDLALGVVPRSGVAGEDRVLLYSPALGWIEDRPLPPRAGRPEWNVPSIGASLVDSPSGVMVATVARGGPGAVAGVLPGDRVLAAGGVKLTRAADANAAVRAVARGSKLVVEIAPPQGERRTVEVLPITRPRVEAILAEGDSAIVRAAWAAADAAAGGSEAPVALANFAALLERAGRSGPAADAWRKVRAIAGESVALLARADYALGVAAASGGAASEAAELFGRAKAEAEQAGDVVLAAAAADRLADLGIAAR
jgi:tetratricopeptide (TPR) repeat protein